MTVRGLALAVLALVVVLAGCAAQPGAPDSPLPQQLVEAVTGDGAYRHLEALQRIADANGGTRALGTPGYDASVEHVAKVLRDAGYQVQTPSFTVRNFVPGETRLAVGGTGTPARVLAYSPGGTADAPLTVIAQDATSGCEAADFAGIPAGAVVLVRRGTCPFGQKSRTAAAAGATAVIVADNVDESGGGFTIGEDAIGTVPTVVVTRALGDELAGRAGSPVELSVTATTEQVTTRNVLAQTTTGDAGRVVMAGAHLDSVREGPGINDNGSGVAALLETATHLGPTPPVANAVRFAFWGAEEEGLVGSTTYVSTLPEAEREQIAAYLNFDMVASPNAGYLVYDGDDSDRKGAGPGPAGSDVLERILVEGLGAAGVTAEGADFTGRSDYGPFIKAGIPAGGIFTGAEERKAPDQAQAWGGQPGAAYDRCYHQACDRLENVDRVALDRNTDAVASTVARLALSTDLLTSH